MRIRKPTSPILSNTLRPLVALALVILGVMTALGIGAAQHPAAAPEPPAAPPPILVPPEPPRPAPRGAEIAVQVEAVVAPEASAQAAPGAADEPSARCHRPRYLFRRGR